MVLLRIYTSEGPAASYQERAPALDHGRGSSMTSLVVYIVRTSTRVCERAIFFGRPIPSRLAER